MSWALMTLNGGAPGVRPPGMNRGIAHEFSLHGNGAVTPDFIVTNAAGAALVEGGLANGGTTSPLPHVNGT